MKNDDIGHILESWPFDPEEELIVRIIEGENGPRLQMRVDLGVVQMRLDGSPSGESPEGFDSWFDHYLDRQRRQESSGIDDFFTLGEEECAFLRREAVHYYYRYLCLMSLEDYDRVARDTDRNLRLFTFVKRYAVREIDRWSLDQYRPYVIMMNARARCARLVGGAGLEIGDAGVESPADGDAGTNDDYGAIHEALEIVDTGIAKIMDFHHEYGLDADMDGSIELSILKAIKNGLMRHLPPTLEEQLERALKEQRFEDAAELRDRIQGRGGASP